MQEKEWGVAKHAHHTEMTTITMRRYVGGSAYNRKTGHAQL
jgi:hypothetical protein